MLIPSVLAFLIATHGINTQLAFLYAHTEIGAVSQIRTSIRKFISQPQAKTSLVSFGYNMYNAIIPLCLVFCRWILNNLHLVNRIQIQRLEISHSLRSVHFQDMIVHHNLNARLSPDRGNTINYNNTRSLRQQVNHIKRIILQTIHVYLVTVNQGFYNSSSCSNSHTG